MRVEAIERVIAAQARGETAVVLTSLADGRQTVMVSGKAIGTLPLNDNLRGLARRAGEAGRAEIVETTEGRIFLNVFAPPSRLIIVGAVHIADPLIRIAAVAGWRVIVVDPRQAWRNRPPFADCTIVGDWPEAALKSLAPDRNTAIVTLTHDPKLDDPALLAAVRSPAFYIGALGSRRTHASRLARLKAAGAEDLELARVRGPVGLPIGALTPAEIAISILAEITQVRRTGDRSEALP